jgi:hypothetical protein
MHANAKFGPGVALLMAALAGCSGPGSGGGEPPSLALRPFETGPPPAPPPAPAPSRPALPAARLAELRDAGLAAHTAFLAQERAAAPLARAAAGKPFESNARAAALVAMADLDARRAAMAGTLATLDSLVADAATALSPDPALSAVQTEIAALLDRQDEGIARLWETMGS